MLWWEDRKILKTPVCYLKSNYILNDLGGSQNVNANHKWIKVSLEKFQLVKKTKVDYSSSFRSFQAWAFQLSGSPSCNQISDASIIVILSWLGFLESEPEMKILKPVISGGELPGETCKWVSEDR